jgi:hypothetical protein
MKRKTELRRSLDRGASRCGVVVYRPAGDATARR